MGSRSSTARGVSGLPVRPVRSSCANIGRIGAAASSRRSGSSAPVLLAHVALGRVAAGFAMRYPEVRLEVVAEDRMVDPVDEGFDVVIRINPAPDDRLIGCCFPRDALVMVATPARLGEGELVISSGLKNAYIPMNCLMFIAKML